MVTQTLEEDRILVHRHHPMVVVKVENTMTTTQEMDWQVCLFSEDQDRTSPSSLQFQTQDSVVPDDFLDTMQTLEQVVRPSTFVRMMDE